MRAIFRQSIILLLLALIPAIASGIFHPKRPDWKSQPEISLSEVRSLKNVIWVDARPSKDYEQSHIPGALSLNEDQWNELLPVFLGTWKPGQTIVVYCNTQTCDSSKGVAKRIKESGLEPVFILKGGWEEWKKANP